MLSGKVISISKDKGFGFIQPETGEGDLFFHSSSVEGGFAEMQVDEVVQYEPDPAATKPRAKFVRRLRAASEKPDSRVAPHGGARQRAQPQPVLQHAELGFITKLRLRTRLGFISADTGGPELLFGSENVSGERPFARLSVGDSVRFVRGVDTDEVGPPLATIVQYAERKPKKFADLELPNNPKARRKKPTWR